MRQFSGKTVVYGITGGIAAYKAPLVIRLLKKAGCEVVPVVTAAAREFVTPLTLQTVAEGPVYGEMFAPLTPGAHNVEHVALAQRADLLLIAPLTANTLAKLATGQADNLLTCTYLATAAPTLLCPAMNTGMWQHAATQANLELLKQRGALVLEPACGMLACGVEGQGRMPEPEAIAFAAFKALSSQDLQGKRVLITCGPTAEDIDPVRFITNRSTGLMGACLAEAATLRGATITVISGPVALDYAPGVEVVKVRSAADMLAAVESRLESCDALVMAAAVADYTPAKRSAHKIKKGEMANLELGRTADVLATIKPLKGAKVYVGFAAETQNELENAQDKLERKGLDLIVANTVGQPGTGFAASTNNGALLAPGKAPEHFNGMPKTELADLILDRVKDLL